MTINEKLRTFLKEKGISINAFEKSIGVSGGYLRHTDNLSGDVLRRICKVYPDISAEWLLRDGDIIPLIQQVGDITGSEVSGVNVAGDTILSPSEGYKDLLQIVKKYQEQTSVFQQQISDLIELLKIHKDK